MRASSGIARLFVLGLGAWGAGCAAPVARGPSGANIGNQGAAWEVILTGGQAGAELVAGSETARCDESLNHRDQDLMDADRPSLGRARRVSIRDRADDLVYFQSDRVYRDGGVYPRR